MIVGSPECTPFSTIQNLNMRTLEGKEKVERVRGEGTNNFEFCCKIYMLQMEAGRYFVHEHPITATSLATECMTKLRDCLALYTAEAPHVRIRDAVQGKTRARVREEADDILDQFNNAGKSPEQKMP